MTRTRLILRSVTYHWRTNIAVALGVATSVAVLSGALLVGDSVRGSLRDIAVGRLGRTDVVISSRGFFRGALAADVQHAAGASAAVPLIIANGAATHERSGRRASSVAVYGVDERFWAFHGQSSHARVLMSPALARELAAMPDDVLLLRVQKPSAIPMESLFGRKDDVARTVRLTIAGVLPREQLGEFSLQPRQTEIRALFVPLSEIQRDLAVQGLVNTVLLSGIDAKAAEAGVAGVVRLEDLDATVAISGTPPELVVESHAGIVSEALEQAARDAGQTLGLHAVPVFTYLANSIRKGDRAIPYSLVTATDLAQVAVRSPAASAASNSIVLNDWAAHELNASPGDEVALDFFLWDMAAGLTTHTARFTVSAVVPIDGFAADRRLAPEYPGITAANSLSDWDPPFPVDLSRVRPRDEAYWKTYRTTPKAFIDFERGRDLWKTRYGAATSVRFPLPAGVDPQNIANSLRDAMRPRLRPASAGLTISAARRDALAASQGATDFGEYFTYFSFFLVLSAVLLALLFFRLGIEQRLRQIGILRAAGFTTRQLGVLLLAEAVALAIAGSVLGMAGALGYGAVMVYGLRTWWVGAVGTSLLTLHVSWLSLLLGAAAGVIAAAGCVVLSLRAVARLSPRALLTAHSIETEHVSAARSGGRRIWRWVFAAAGAAMVGTAFADGAAASGLFFAAGGAFLAACMAQLAASLRGRARHALKGRGAWTAWRLGFRSAAFRPSRSVLCATLIASAVFIIVSVGAFRHGDEIATDVHSGTGGFALLAQSEVPIIANPNDAAGREALVVNAPDFSRIRFTRFRLRPGQDASCLNLYRPTAPTIVAPEPAFLDQSRFAFSSSMAESDAERRNPWLLLRRDMPDAVPAIADATSLQYVLHASVGDTFSIDTGGEQPLVLRFVGALRDSVLQGEIVISETHFLRLFPQQQGYRLFLIDDPAAAGRESVATLAATLERELAPFGFDAVSTADRLRSFHEVENTYLSTFQALGGLGLLLGTIGLSAIMFRNVLERRRELALLRAVGYDRRRISTIIVGEAALLLAAGLASGVACAALAIAPAWLGRGGTMPGPWLAILVATVAGAGLVSSTLATRAAISGNMLDALRGE